MIHVLNPINFFKKCPPVNSYRSSSSTDCRTESAFLYSLRPGCTRGKMTVFIFIGITTATDPNTVIMRNDNLFIYKCDTTWQKRAHTSKDLRHRDEVRCMPQGCPLPVRETSGTRRQERAHTSKDLRHRDTMKLRREELIMAASGPPGTLPPGTKSWHLDT